MALPWEPLPHTAAIMGFSSKGWTDECVLPVECGQALHPPVRVSLLSAGKSAIHKLTTTNYIYVTVNIA